jgi:hypothetical protein
MRWRAKLGLKLNRKLTTLPLTSLGVRTGRKNKIAERGLTVAKRRRMKKTRKTKTLIPTLVHQRKVARADI